MADSAHFDHWAEHYDATIVEATGAGAFPFAGYAQVLDTVCALVEPCLGKLVLDLGTGTGNVALQLVQAGCRVIGVDFSSCMLERAALKVPGASLVQADMRAAWPAELDGPFDEIVSAYLLHEFDTETKAATLQSAAQRLKPSGRIVIGDIAFSSAQHLAEAQLRWAESWDDNEHYWTAEHADMWAHRIGLRAQWQRVSECAGVVVFMRR